jgi:uncharacterized protein (TIGR03083 family)
MTGTDETDAAPAARGMDDDALLAALSAAIGVFEAIPTDALDRPVPGCPGWSLADLVEHTTRIHRWATAHVVTTTDERPRFPKDDVGSGAALLATFAGNGAALIDALRAADLDRTVPTFIGPQPARWWLRRQAHETAVHAWDVGSALGTPSPLDAALAVDGIDELFDVFFVHRFDAQAFAGTGETMHLHATDVDGEWLVRFAPDGPVVTREHAKGDVAARGAASDLLLFLWTRVGPAQLETFGDVTVLERYQAVTSL